MYIEIEEIKKFAFYIFLYSRFVSNIMIKLFVRFTYICGNCVRQGIPAWRRPFLFAFTLHKFQGGDINGRALDLGKAPTSS